MEIAIYNTHRAPFRRFRSPARSAHFPHGDIRGLLRLSPARRTMSCGVDVVETSSSCSATKNCRKFWAMWSFSPTARSTSSLMNWVTSSSHWTAARTAASAESNACCGAGDGRDGHAAAGFDDVMGELQGVQALLVGLPVEESRQLRQAVAVEIGGDVDVLQGIGLCIPRPPAYTPPPPRQSALRAPTSAILSPPPPHET